MHFKNTCSLIHQGVVLVNKQKSKQMEKKKINFSNIKGMLSTDQMKRIKGGSTPKTCGSICHSVSYQQGYCITYSNTYESQCMCNVNGVLNLTSECSLQ